MLRILKIAAALFIGVIGLLFGLDNLFNLEAAYDAVSLIVSGAEQPYYRILGPTVGPGWPTWVALFTIITGELTTGLLGFSGMWRMIRARPASAEEFREAKNLAILGGAVGMLVWYGFFVVIGESYFHMWQSELGLGSVEGAFRYGTVCAVLMFFIASRDE
jgi:predicted small integral membrane protein